MGISKRSTAGPPSGGVITALVAKRGDAERTVVYLDGARAFDLASEVADAEGLRVGRQLSAGDVERLLEQDAPHRAKEKAVRLLSASDRSCREVEGRLLQLGFEPEVVAATIAWLRALRYVDDERFAAHYAAEKRRGGWGGRRIAAELAQRGVDRTTVKHALDETGGEDRSAAGDEPADRVVELARRRFGRLFQSDPQSAARRLAGYLGRRGFDWDTIRAVTRVLEQESGAGRAADSDREGQFP